MKFLPLLVGSTVALGLLTGCSASEPTDSATPESEPTAVSESPEPEVPSWSIPESCAVESVIDVLDSSGFPGVEDLTPSWTPAAGTDLAAALDGGGIACGYGIPETDSGITIYWVPDAAAVFDATATGLWTVEGASTVDLALSRDEVTAYFQYVEMDSTNLYPHWEVNVLFDGGLWVHVATSSWIEPDDGNSVIEAMLEAAEG
jgi:hypothetical protein